MSILSKIRLAKLYMRNHWNKKLVHICGNQHIFSKVIFEGTGYIGPNASITGSGSVKIGDNTIIGPNVEIMTTVHNYDSELLPYDSRQNITKNIIIGRNVWIGSDVIIMPGVIIGEGSVIGAKSFVNKNISKCSIVVGTPAKVIKKRNVEKYEELCKSNKLYLYKKYSLNSKEIR
ncbi:acyltransferase [Limosilactobacillus fermentum]|uniref:acyltransferase n=1 Tax=Limosilactobacillus fermentum TaxID=1613 RepID=UPI000D2FD832|nr:acyltransferase [Limosilactobacillus fermentum]PTV35345.1 acyltransferase [Limosilactobacillus fermentum]QAR24110.1 acyltransferase [Limosilactobacillus fermentum]